MDRVGPGPSSACSAPVKSRTWIEEFHAILVRQIGSLPARRLWFEDYNEVHPHSGLLAIFSPPRGFLSGSRSRLREHRRHPYRLVDAEATNQRQCPSDRNWPPRLIADPLQHMSYTVKNESP